MSELVQQMSGLLEDESAVTVRLALSALKLCVPSLSHGHHSSLAVKLLLAAIQLRHNSYWLVKVSSIAVQRSSSAGSRSNVYEGRSISNENQCIRLQFFHSLDISEVYILCKHI